MVNYKIYVHGRPQGQDFWCKDEDTKDRQYLNMFLDSKAGSDVSSALIIDTWKNNTYYTYIHCKKLVENSGRPGAYFAITIRFDNAYCKSSSTLYNLLDTAYKKCCIGSLISVDNGVEKITFSQFSEKQDILLKINDLISQNIERVIAPLCSELDNFHDTKDTSAKSYCLTDVDSPTFISDMQKSKLVISPSYKSKEKVHEEDVLRLKPLEDERDGLKRELVDWQSRHANLEEIQRLQEERINSLSKEVNQLTSNADKIKDQVEAQFKPVIAQQEKDLREKQAKLDSVERQLDTCNTQLNTCKNQLTSLQKELERSKKDTLSHNDKEDLLRRMADRFPRLEAESKQPKSTGNSKIYNYLSICNSILLVCIASLVAYFYWEMAGIPQNNNEETQAIVGINNINNRIEEISKSLNELLTKTKAEPKETTNNSHAYSIDLKDYSSNKGREIGKEYKCLLLDCGKSTNESVVWDVTEGNALFNGNVLTMKDSLIVTIVCKDQNGKQLVTRTIDK